MTRAAKHRAHVLGVLFVLVGLAVLGWLAWDHVMTREELVAAFVPVAVGLLLLDFEKTIVDPALRILGALRGSGAP